MFGKKSENKDIVNEVRDYQKQQGERFVQISVEIFSGWAVLVDKETGIEYLAREESGITPILNPDGKPKVNERFQKGLPLTIKEVENETL